MGSLNIDSVYDGRQIANSERVKTHSNDHPKQSCYLFRGADRMNVSIAYCRQCLKRPID